MTLWSITPRDTLVLRDGRPKSGSGTQMTGRAMPVPSTVAGFFRTRSASDADGRFLYVGDKQKLKELRGLAVRGPWLGRIKAGGVEHLLAAPLDAIGFESDDLEHSTVVALHARTDATRQEGVYLDKAGRSLALLFLSESRREKPTSLPAYWSWASYEQWLLEPAKLYGKQKRSALGVDLPRPELRTNVAIDAESNSAADGQLFSIEHSRFELVDQPAGEVPKWSGREQLCVLADCAATSIGEGVTAFAGKRRLVQLKKEPVQVPPMPAGLAKKIAESKRARMLLLTPAFFSEGWRPSWVFAERDDVKIKLRAASVTRPEVLSGWNFETQRPKPSRRFAPAGAVYFIEFAGSAAAIEKWLKDMWWQAISDDEQARLDGFGLAVFGVDASPEEDKS